MGKNNPYALKFENNQYVLCGSPSCYDLGNNAPFTVEAIVNATTLKNYGGIFNKNTSGRNSPYSFMTVLHGDGTLGAYTGSTWVFSQATGIVINKWYHLAYVFDRKTMTFYVDGVNKGSVNFSWADNPLHDVTIGSWYTGNTYDLNGKIDEVRFWKVARTQSEIQENMYKSLVGDETGLIGYWRLDEGSGNIAIDSSINKNNGNIINSTYVNDSVDLKDFFISIDYDIMFDYLWETDNNKNPIINLKLDGKYGNNFNYRVLDENLKEIMPVRASAQSPLNLTVEIDNSKLVFEKNNIVIEVINENNKKYYFGIYLITKENRDTTTFTRQIISKNDWEIGNNGQIIDGELKLITNGENIFTTNDNSNIHTTSKRKINYIRVDGDEDIVKDSVFVEEFNNPIAIENGYVQEYDLRLNRFVEVKSIGFEV